MVRDHSGGDRSRIIVEYRDAAGAVLASYDSGEIRHAWWRALSDMRTAPAGTRTIRVRLLGRRTGGSYTDAYFDALLLRALEVPSISAADVVVIEGESGQSDASFPVQLSCAASFPVAVDYLTSDGTATSGSDYESTSGRLVFAPGQTQATLGVPVFGDTFDEPQENFYLNFANPENGGVADGRAEATIVPDEVMLTIDSTDVPEGADGSTPAVLTLTLSGPSTLTIRVDYATDGGTATGSADDPAAADYTSTAGTAIFAPGELVKTVTVDVLGDLEVESDEVIRVELTNPVNVTLGDPRGEIIIVQDDIGVSIADANVNEGNTGTGELRFDIDLTAAATQEVRVSYATRDGTATAGLDYVPAEATVSFAPGQTRKTVIVQVLGDEEQELGETLFVDLSDPVLAFVTDGEATGFIAASEEVATVDWATADGTATAAEDDYVAATGTVTFQPGETVQVVEVEVLGDFEKEIRETFTLELSGEVNLALLDTSAEAVIRDADPGAPPVAGAKGSYTLDADFDLGTSVSVHHDVPLNDQLQLSPEGSTFPFIWIALSGRDSIAKIDIETGEILGEYSTNPDNAGRSNPSRTTVSLDGSVWVGNRNDQSVAHVGLPELNQCVDRNGNGVIETSFGYGDVLPWPNLSGADTNGGASTAEDECILHYVLTSSSGTRHISIDKDNNVWVSGTGNRNFNYIDGDTGQILRTETGFGCGGYGGLIDGNGIIWSVASNGGVLRWDPSVVPPTSASKRCINGLNPYGIGIDPDGWIWISSYWADRLRRISPSGTPNSFTWGHGSYYAQGLAVDGKGHVWTSSSLHDSGYTTVGHNLQDGRFVGNVTGVPRGSTGVAIDANGKVWVANHRSNTAARIDPDAGPIGNHGIRRGAVDLVVQLPGASPCNYSDMTGFVALQATAPQGNWSVIQDSGTGGTEWATVTWNTEAEGFVPDGGSIAVEVRASDTLPGLGSQPWVRIENGEPFSQSGRFLQVRVTMRPDAEGTSPVLSDLYVVALGQAEISIGDVTVTPVRHWCQARSRPLTARSSASSRSTWRSARSTPASPPR